MKKNKWFELYKWTNKKNGKSYIGVTSKTFKERWKKHVNDAMVGSNSIFHKAIRKHGTKSFKGQLIGAAFSEEAAKRSEIKFIKEYKTHMSQEGYNMTWGGDCRLSWTEGAKKKLSESLKGNQYTKGRIIPKEERARISKSLKGLIKGEEWQDKISSSLKKIPRTEEWNKKNLLNQPNRTSVTIEGKEYNSIREASRELGWSRDKIKKNG